MGKSEMGTPAPAQLLDSGLCGLSLVAGYYRIAGDPVQLRHQLALTGRNAQVEDIVRGANWTCPAFAESVFKFTRPASRTEAG
jgi:hypothetical protein